MSTPSRFLPAAVLLLCTQAALAEPKNGLVTLNCPVVGATVFVNGKEIGLVPVDRFEMRFGTHEIQVKREGLIDFRQSITLRPGQDIVVNALPDSARALLTVATAVRGGEVLLDGDSLGPLPVNGRPVAP